MTRFFNTAFMVICIGLLGLNCGNQEPDIIDQVDTPPLDEAQVIANRVMDAMGGKENWDNTRYLRFSFFGFRTHHWDKWTGRFRVSWTDRQSKKDYLILMNLNTKEGKAFVAGEEVTDAEELQELMTRGERAWINDTYWLLMPYKLQDPGVNLVYEGEVTIDEKMYDKLHLSFNDVGVTTGDEYWAYINKETHLMDKWEYLLQSREGQEERSRGEWKWNNWQPYGSILLSAEREGTDGTKRAHGDVGVFDHMADAIFSSRDAVTDEMLHASDATPTSQPAAATSQPD